MDQSEPGNEILNAYTLGGTDKPANQSGWQSKEFQADAVNVDQESRLTAEYRNLQSGTQHSPASTEGECGAVQTTADVCGECGGTGRCYWCKGTAQKSVIGVGDVPCQICHQTGICHTCNGQTVITEKSTTTRSIPTETWSDTYRDRSDTSLRSKPMQSSNEGGCLLAIAGVACIAISPLFGCLMPIPFAIGLGLCGKANKKIWKD